MIFVPLWYLMLTTVLNVCNGHRRLVGGKNVTTHHAFMVYLRKAEADPRGYIAWLCGGALVGSRVVLTSAACVEDVQYLYVVAGYDKYVDDQRSDDKCLQNTVKKVIHICVPKAYDLIYEELDKWANYDIAVVKVDADIIGDPNYKKYCSYEPQKININYNDENLQKVGREAMVLGWGHNKHWRKPNDNRNFNKKKLQYVSTLIYDKQKCMKAYKAFAMDLVISKYMICTLEPAYFDDQGENLYEVDCKGKDGCGDEVNSQDTSVEEMTKKLKRVKRKPSGEQDSAETVPASAENITEVGICQNDHGGPLISWARSKPKVIGIASVFQVKDGDCAGPYLFTSTYCSSKFLKCVVDAFSNNEKPGARRTMSDYCYLPPKEKGFEIIERRIAWNPNADKSEEDDQYLVRPQKPLRHISQG